VLEKINFAAVLAFVALPYGLAGFFLYRARRLGVDGWLNSDIIVIYGPFLIAVLIGTLIIDRQLSKLSDEQPRSERLRFAGAVAFAIALTTAAIYFAIAINHYGT
jgi:hypothetical protein